MFGTVWLQCYIHYKTKQEQHETFVNLITRISYHLKRLCFSLSHPEICRMTTMDDVEGKQKIKYRIAWASESAKMRTNEINNWFVEFSSVQSDCNADALPVFITLEMHCTSASLLEFICSDFAVYKKNGLFILRATGRKNFFPHLFHLISRRVQLLHKNRIILLI